MITITMDDADFVSLLNDRYEFVTEHYGWHCPKCLWDYYTDYCCQCDSYNSNINEIVDNFIVNADWGYFDDYKQEDESDEEFIARVEDDVRYLNKEERVVWF